MTAPLLWVLAGTEPSASRPQPTRVPPRALMTDDGHPIVAIVPSMVSRFQRTPAELQVRDIRTQMAHAAHNGKIDAHTEHPAGPRCSTDRNPMI